jgi:phosphoribosylformylglycinamidine cyclo-ligase
MKKYDTVGIDCVAMSVNDILCTGAKPLYFLDYIACGSLDSSIAADLVKGVADGCVDSDCALLGGETAEMPGFYDKGKYDIAGFGVGIVDKQNIITGEAIKEGDVLIGLSSTGVHSNGFSLVRKLVTDFDTPFNGRKIGEVLLEPTRIYVRPVLAVLDKFRGQGGVNAVHGMAHITGGGFYENIPRMFPEGIGAKVQKNSYEVPTIFKLLRSAGEIEEQMMYNTYNMGVGMMLAVDPTQADAAVKALNAAGEKAFIVGETVSGEKSVTIC